MSFRFALSGIAPVPVVTQFYPARTFNSYSDAVDDALSTAETQARGIWIRPADESQGDSTLLHPEAGGFVFEVFTASGALKWAYVYTVSQFVDHMNLDALWNNGIASTAARWAMFHTHQKGSYTNTNGYEVALLPDRFSPQDENALRVYGSNAFGPSQPNPWFTSYVRIIGDGTLSWQLGFPRPGD